MTLKQTILTRLGKGEGRHREDAADTSEQSVRRVACLLLPGFSILSMASAVEAMQACNRLTGEHRYRCEMLGPENETASDSGVEVATIPIYSLVDKDIDGLIVCGGAPADYPDDDAELIQWLTEHHRHFQWLAAIGTGGVCLARAGLLNRRKASVHWWSLSELRQDFPDVNFSTDVFSIDDGIATCRSGTAALDMMYTLIGRHQGHDMVDALSQHFVRERVGHASVMAERQQLSDMQKQEQPALHDAILLMEANVEEPLSTDDIAGHVALSRRQLERLFRKYLDTVPSRYYLQVRLEVARSRLQSEPLPISDVALSCGFSSAAHFSTAYRNHYGLTPSEERALAGES